MAKAEYIEGPEALERFKALMAQAFQAPKSKTPFAKPKAKKTGTRAALKKRVPRRASGDAAG
jgi:hypothetical protein